MMYCAGCGSREQHYTAVHFCVSDRLGVSRLVWQFRVAMGHTRDVLKRAPNLDTNVAVPSRAVAGRGFTPVPDFCIHQLLRLFRAAQTDCCNELGLSIGLCAAAGLFLSPREQAARPASRSCDASTVSLSAFNQAPYDPNSPGVHHTYTRPPYDSCFPQQPFPARDFACCGCQLPAALLLRSGRHLYAGR